MSKSKTGMSGLAFTALAGKVRTVNDESKVTQKSLLNPLQSNSVADSLRGTNRIACAPQLVRVPNIPSSFASQFCSSFFESFVDSPIHSETFVETSKIEHSIDTLMVSLWLEWFHYDFYKLLDEKRSMARELEKESVIVHFGNETWNVHRFASSYFRYQISSGDVHIFLSKHKADGRVPNCKIEIGSLSCWDGTEQIFNNLVGMLTSHGCNLLKEVVGRVDLCADLIGTNVRSLNVSNEENWICKAKNNTQHSEHRKLTSIAYGKGNLMLRIYNKVAELKNKKATNKQLEFAKIWGVKNYDDKEVTRTEFQFRREVLAQFTEGEDSITTVAQVIDQQQSLWSYATETWARHNENKVDRLNRNQGRSKISTFWSKIISIDWGKEPWLTRSVTKCRKNLDAIAEQMRGLAITLVSANGNDVDDYFGIMSEAKKQLEEQLHKYMTEDYTKFFHKYQQRQVESMLAVT